MNDSCQGVVTETGPAGRWAELAEGVLDGRRLTEREGLAVLRSPDHELLELLAAAYRVRHRWFGNRVYLNFLANAKSGLCSENCGYCSQSRVSTAEIRKYDMLGPEALIEGARLAAQRKAATYCMVISGRGVLEREVATIVEVVPQIKQRWDLNVCVSVGLLRADQAARLKACGVDRVNHNLNTSEAFYPNICSTHGYRDRLTTLRTIRETGLEICSGGIIGMGERDADVVELALRLGELEVEALPVNFLIPVKGTAMEGVWHLDPRYCLKVLSLFRLANPKTELRIAAGRETHLGVLQPLGLYPASSIFVGDYLTTQGQAPEEDYRMINQMGFQPVPKSPAASDES